MKILLASVIALGLLGAASAADAAIVGVHVGPIGLGIGHHYHHHYYRHYRHWHR